MKRTLSILLACALTLSLLASCGGGDKSGSGGGSSSSNSGTSSSEPAGSGSQSEEDSSGDVSQPDASEPDASTPDASTPEPLPADPETPVLTMNRTEFSLFTAGSTFRLRYTCEPDYDAIPEFSSSNESVATVAEDGTVTAVAPGRTVITLKYADLTAQCTVYCKWEEKEPDVPSSGGATTPEPTPDPAPGSVDLAAFYETFLSKYSHPSMENVGTYFMPELDSISTAQCLVYAPMMSGVACEIALVQVNNAGDVNRVKSIFQARIDAQAAGGAWYPAVVEVWENNARIVSNGNYVMMIAHEQSASIVKDFNALF